METIKNFDDLIAHLSQKGERKRVAIVWASDDHTQEAVAEGLKGGFVEALFVGARKEIESSDLLRPYADHFTIIDSDDKDDAAAKAVASCSSSNSPTITVFTRMTQ